MGQTLGRTFEGELGCAIARGTGVNMPPGLRAHVEERALALVADLRQQSLGDVERAMEISLKNAFQLLLTDDTMGVSRIV